jgi:hypothetical protein
MAALALAYPTLASADEGAPAANPGLRDELHAPPPTVDDAALERRRMSALVDTYAEQSRSSRRWLGGASIALGTAALGASVAVTIRERNVPGIVIGIQGASGVASGLYGLVSEGPLESLQGTIQRSRGLGLSDAATLEVVSREWDALAARERSRRRVLGTLEAAVGALFAASSVVLALTPPDLLGLTGLDQTLSVSLLAGFGAAHVLEGVLVVVQPSPLEQAHDAFRMGQTAKMNLRVGAAPAGVGHGHVITLGGTW